MSPPANDNGMRSAVLITEQTPDVYISQILSSTLEYLESRQVTSSTGNVMPSPEDIQKARSALIAELPDKSFQAQPHPDAASSHLITLQHIIENIVPALPRSSLSSNYYGFVTGGATPAALAADILGVILDQNIQVHLPKQSIATELEVNALNMLIEAFVLPQEWLVGQLGSAGGSGTFTTGATASNVIGLALGREHVISRAAKSKGYTTSAGEQGFFESMTAAGLRSIQVLSTLPHSSIAKAASIVGIGRKNCISIAKGDLDIDIDFDLLEEHASISDTATIIVVSCGEVNTGFFATNSTHHMQQLRKLADKYGCWIHVDSAFGLCARLLTGNKADQAEFGFIIGGTEGIELADSITGDAHKLLNVPYDCGFFLTRHKTLLEDVFRNGNAAYLSSDSTVADIQSPLNIGIENSRRFRALPVYATLSTYGRIGYQDMLRRQIRLARRIALWIDKSDEYYLLPPKSSIDSVFIIVLFCARDLQLNKELVEKINNTRQIYVTGTKWDGESAARIAVSNWQADVERDGALIEKVLSSVAEQN